MAYVAQKMRGKSERVLERGGRELVDGHMQDWLHQPQKKLAGRTPFEVIEAERSARAARGFGEPPGDVN